MAIVSFVIFEMVQIRQNLLLMKKASTANMRMKMTQMISWGRMETTNAITMIAAIRARTQTDNLILFNRRPPLLG